MEKGTFISSVSPYPEEEYYLGKSTWSTTAADWDQRFEVGDVIANPSGSWTPGTAEAYIDQQVGILNTNLTSEIIARQNGDSNLHTQLQSEMATRADQDANLNALINAGIREGGGVQFDTVPTQNSANGITSGGMYSTLRDSNVGFVDEEPTAGSDNLVKSGGIKEAIDELGIDNDGNPKYEVTDPNGNVGMRLDSHGLNIKKINFCNEEGEIENTIDKDYLSNIKNGNIKDSFKKFDANSVCAKFFAERNTLRSVYLTDNSKTVYWDPVSGDNTNSGLTSTAAIKTFSRVIELLSNGDTLLIKRGSVITDVCVMPALNGIKIDAYGIPGDNKPLFSNFVTISGFEKVNGYNNIYRVQKHYAAVTWNMNTYMQCYVDGARLGNDIESNSLANKVSCRNIKNYADAMIYLDANPDNACWFSGFERDASAEHPTWVEGDYYWYVSLSDAPSNHTIEVTNNPVITCFNLASCSHTDIRNIDTRGGASKDGWHIGKNVIMENCVSYDYPNYGMLQQGGFWYCLDCAVINKSGSCGTQFHIFGDIYNENLGQDCIFIGCSVESAKNWCVGFAGHYSGSSEQDYPILKSLYLIDCKCTGVFNAVTAFMAESCYIKDFEIADTLSVCCGYNIMIDGIKGELYTEKSQLTFYKIVSTADTNLFVKNAILKFIEETTVYGAGGFIYCNQDETIMDECPINAEFVDCKFIFDKKQGVGYGVDSYNFIIPGSSEFMFRNCAFSVKNGTSYNQVITSRPTYTNLKFEDCCFFGIANNINDTNCVKDCTFYDSIALNTPAKLFSLIYNSDNIIKVLDY